jgi:hypothetical protein
MRLNDLASQLVEASESGSSFETEMGKAKSFPEIYRILAEFNNAFLYRFELGKFNHLESVGINIDDGGQDVKAQMLYRMETLPEAAKLQQVLLGLNLSGLSKLRYKKEAIKRKEIFGFAEFGETKYWKSPNRTVNPQKSDIKKTVSEIQKKLDAYAPDMFIVVPSPQFEDTMTDDGGRIAFSVYLGPKMVGAVSGALDRILNRPDNLKYVSFPTEKELADYLQDEIGTRTNGYFTFGGQYLTVEAVGYGNFVREKISSPLGNETLTKWGVHLSLSTKEGGLMERFRHAIANALFKKYKNIYRYNGTNIFDISRTNMISFGIGDGLTSVNIDPSDYLLAVWKNKTVPNYKMDANYVESLDSSKFYY